jgi:uncharacterized protein (TIGR00270 family)
MPCELCGRECKGGREAIIDGAKMFVCPDCIKFAGNQLQEEPTRVSQPINVPRFIAKKTQRPEHDIFKDKRMEKELVSNWNHLIEQARKKKNLTREELGFKIGERTVTIAKLENGDLRPSDQTIAKLEKELGISLMEEIKTAPTATQTQAQGRYTLGDFIKTEK